MKNHLTSTGLLTLIVCSAHHALADVQFHDVLTGSSAHSSAQAGGIQDSDPQQSGGNNFMDASHHVVSYAAAGDKAMSSCHAASELLREENTIWIWGYATANTYAEGDGVARVEQASGGAQLEFTLDRPARFDLQSCRVWDSESPLGQAMCVLSKRGGDMIFRHNLLDPQDCMAFSIVLDAGTYSFNAHAHLWSANEGAGSVDEWAEINVKFSLDEIELLGDVDNDGDVDGADLAKFLGSWGYDDPETDFNGDGIVDGQDLAILLGNWT